MSSAAWITSVSKPAARNQPSMSSTALGPVHPLLECDGIRHGLGRHHDVEHHEPPLGRQHLRDPIEQPLFPGTVEMMDGEGGDHQVEWFRR
jgi:hypothetical protein